MHVQEWKMRYKGASFYLQKIMKPQVDLDKAQSHMLIWNYEKLHLLITKIEAAYERLFKSLDVIVRTHTVPSSGTLTQAMKANQVLLEVDRDIKAWYQAWYQFITEDHQGDVSDLVFPQDPK